MNLKVKQKKKNHLIQKIKRINYLNLDLNIINNKDMFNNFNYIFSIEIIYLINIKIN